MNKYTLPVAVAILLIIGAIYYTRAPGTPPTETVSTATTTPEQATTTTTGSVGVVTDNNVPVSTTANQTIAITQADNDKIVHVKKGTRIALALGEDVWTLRLSPTGIVNRITYIATMRGIQGIYTADTIGSTTLTGEGRPNCAGKEVCAQYIISFKTTIVVEK
jgi:hypothetical protein